MELLLNFQKIFNKNIEEESLRVKIFKNTLQLLLLIYMKLEILHKIIKATMMCHTTVWGKSKVI